MPSRALPGLGLTGYYDTGEDGWDATMNPDLRLLSVVSQIAVDSLAAAEPGSPVQGDMVLLTATANADSIAVYDDGAWVYLAPNAGWRLYDIATGDNYQFDGSAWAVEAGGASPALSLTYDDRAASFSLTDAQLDGKTVIRMTGASAQIITVPASLVNLNSVLIVRRGAGSVTLATSGTTIESRGGLLALNGLYAQAALTNYGSNVFALAGDLA